MHKQGKKAILHIFSSFNNTISFRVGSDVIKYTASPLPLKSSTQIAFQVRTANTATSFTYFDRAKIYKL